MKPYKALELVLRYAHLTKAIKLATKNIGTHLDLCNGFSGNRLKNILSFNAPDVDIDEKGRDRDVHLVAWYTPKPSGDYGRPEWEAITQDEHQPICPHCYAAHLAVEQRKALRQALGSVKRSMSRSLA